MILNLRPASQLQILSATLPQTHIASKFTLTSSVKEKLILFGCVVRTRGSVLTRGFARTRGFALARGFALTRGVSRPWLHC